MTQTRLDPLDDPRDASPLRRSRRWSTRDASVREWLDADDFDAAALRHNLRDIRRINGLLGWRPLAVRGVARQVRAARLRAFSLLDVASGSADIPAAIARWASRANIAARIVATDLSPQIVAIAREACAGTHGLSIERQDALALPYAAGSFDFALCTLALHHFAPDEAIRVLSEMARVSRRVLVYDAQRARLAFLGVIVLTRVLRMSAMTCHDAPASVRRAYTARELRTLAAHAGLREVSVRVRVPYRLELIASGGIASDASPATGRAR
ncbi:MAG: methyltransferase domain-containing protein [Ktedonobacterales bacterium]